MAEIAVFYAVDKLLPLLREEANLLKGNHREFADIKDELESIQAFLKDADRRAAAEGDNRDEGIKTWVKHLREAAFRIEDVIDEYMMYLAQQPYDHGCAASLSKIYHLIKTLKQQHRIASEIRDIKSSVRGIKQRSIDYSFQIHPSFQQGSSSSRGSQSFKWRDPRMASLYIEEAEVVGFEAPRDELISWLVEGPANRTVVSVVGMGGQGKTTLAKKVYDNQKVVRHFDCHAWITVSQSYTAEGLLRDMLQKFGKEKSEATLHGVLETDRDSLINEVRNYLQQRRYVVVFDDIWNVHFWDEIEFAVLDNKNGSRVFITTRNRDVAMFCKKSSCVQVHELQPLSEKKSMELFCKRAFQFDFNGCCPNDLMDISFEIVKKCKGVPLAIVAIGGLLSSKDKTTFEWKEFNRNLSSELEKNPRLNGITKILGFSYDDLPYYLKPCLLYFGIYPEDYDSSSNRLIRQWIAEGFVKEERGKTLEEVAKQHLTELIHRGLVQVSSFGVDGKAKRCHVHDLLREMILRKFEDLSFCQLVSEDDQLICVEIIRRLAIATNSNNLSREVEHCMHIRSLQIFRDEELPDYFVRRIPTKCRLLKVLDFENTPLNYVPENLGNLLHLRYLSLRETKVRSLPKSIGKLQNLETLDVRGTNVQEMPKELNKLKKLRHLVAYLAHWGNNDGIDIKHGIGGLTSLQTLHHVKANCGGVELIMELGKLKQLRVLGLTHIRQEYGNALCSSINEMQHLEKLYVAAVNENEVIDLHFLSPQLVLGKLRISGKLERLPLLQNLSILSLIFSQLIDDPVKSLKNLSNLLLLSLNAYAYVGESLHFQNGGFQKLKYLRLRDLYGLNSIHVDKGALPSLEDLKFMNIPQLKEVPSGILHLEKLKVFDSVNMPREFEQSIDRKGGQENWIVEHVPQVCAMYTSGSYREFDTHVIRHSRR